MGGKKVNFCPKCGTKRMNDAKFCHECGLNYLKFLETYSDINSQARTSNHKGIVIADDNDFVQSYPKELEPVMFRSLYGTNIHDVLFTPDSKYIGACTSDGIVIWDVFTKEEILKIDTKTEDDSLYYSRPADKLFFTPDRKYLVYVKRNQIFKIKLDDLSVVSKYRIDTYRLKKLTISRDGNLLGGVNDTEVIIWSLAENKLVNTIGHKNRVLSIDFTPDSKYIAVEEDKNNEIKFWDYHNLTVVKKLIVSDRYNGFRTEDKENLLKISPNGRNIAYFGKDEYEVSGFMFYRLERTITVNIREIESGNYVTSVVNEIKFHELESIDFSPSSEWMALGTNRGVYLKSIYEENNQIILYDDNIKRSVKFSPNGRFLAAVDKARVDVWKLL